VNVTLTPDTGLLPASLIVTANAFVKAVLIAALCGVVPALAVIVEEAPTVFVKEKLADRAPAIAVTVYGPPTALFAVNGADATPDALVATVMVAVLLLKVPDAPAPGAVNVTFTPDTGLFPASFTVTASAFAKTVLIATLCGVVPAFAVIADGAPTVFVNEKLTERAPATAVTEYGPPAALFAVNGAAATPDALVATVIVGVLLLNTPMHPSPER